MTNNVLFLENYSEIQISNFLIDLEKGILPKELRKKEVYSLEKELSNLFVDCLYEGINLF